ncbi:MAG: DEAD/DEAH box helicase [Lentisphaeraceae bacterium]|nr:DEAD/DEAH box helicase [Lentisphaeraceae bacterium]
MITPYHAKYFAHELTLAGGKGLDRISQSLFNASVDLNPHQVEAALFALRSPLSNGVMLADEVGLGKTIEAGLIISQYWAERKRKLLIVCPASLRKQWQIELEEKFNLPSRIMDSRLASKIIKEGVVNPFEGKEIVIVSFHFASRMKSEVRELDWDLCVMDEAHKMRNSYRQSSKMGQNFLMALEDTKKLLLTATPLQNSLSEIYGLANLIDDQIFGDFPTFRTMYMKSGGDIDDLRLRLNTFTKRTLRKDVLEYIKYTQRKPTTIKFRPTEDEHKLYLGVSEFLQREDTYALPAKQRHLTVIVVRKVLASSPVALAGTLEVIKERLISLKENAKDDFDITERILEQDDVDEELLDQLFEEMETSYEESCEPEADVIDLKKLEKEIEELDRYILWSRSLGIDTKTKHLLKALDIGYEQLAEMGALEKAVIFTESRRTQEYLKGFLEANGYAGQIATFSGTMTDEASKETYQKWLVDNQDTGRVTGSRAVDLRQSIIDRFRGSAKILIATESASEGINLQFCSLLINFDLPWNPQRVEQRIGRCHRYGQKHDVVVINFLNEKNEADRRVYDLLTHKFRLFDGVFGASDEILGRLDSSASFESRILSLYQECRTPAEIEEGFRKLQLELDEQIQLKLEDTRKQLLENFDEDVHLKLKVEYDEALKKLDSVGQMFWRLSAYFLEDKAEFDHEALCFDLNESPTDKAPEGLYQLIKKGENSGKGQIYRMSHPLGEYVIHEAKDLSLDIQKVTFDITNYPSKLSVIDELKGQTGLLLLNKLSIKSLEQEEFLLFSACKDSGENLDQETVEKLFKLEAQVLDCERPSDEMILRLKKDAELYAQSKTKSVSQENNVLVNEKREQLYRWADDVVKAAENEISTIKAQIRLVEREARNAINLTEQKEAQEKIKKLEKKKRQARKNVFDVEDEIEEKRNRLITQLENRMIQKTTTQTLFVLRWEVI